ncbi:hypothetical protein HDR63_04100, partial [bacterium]|nr:hypothetical protein [bacterium]
FLWFNIGLEINMRRLWQMRHTIFGFGAAQVLMVVAMLFPVLFGVTSWTIMGAVMVALILAMSSMSEDLQILADRNALGTTMGKQTFSILLFQDLLSIPLLAMVPVLAGKSINLGATVIDIVVLSVGLILGVMIVGRLILNPLMRGIARLRSKEVFLLAVVLNIIVWAVVLDMLGLPSSLGAFLAGMLLSETIYQHQVRAEIEPYTTLFMALFFVALGMGLNVPFLMQHWAMVLLGLGGLIFIKFVAIYIVARVRGVSSRDASMIALILAQGGEFGLLILQTMKHSGIEAIPTTHEEILTAIIILSIMATPILLAIYDMLQRRGWLCAHWGAKDVTRPQNAAAAEVIICGFGRVGQIVAQMLDRAGVRYVALDLNVDAVMHGRDMGYNVCYGDTTSERVMRDMGLAPRRTRAVVVALDNSTTAHNTVACVRAIAPRVRIFARARNLAESRALIDDGVQEAQPETIESSFRLAYGVLENIGVSERRIDDLLDEMRANNYAALANGEERR